MGNYKVIVEFTFSFSSLHYPLNIVPYGLPWLVRQNKILRDVTLGCVLFFYLEIINHNKDRLSSVMFIQLNNTNKSYI